MADVAVVGVGANGDRTLQIHALDQSGWKSSLEEPLGTEVLFVDVANVAGRDRLITYESGRLRWFHAESAAHRPLVDISTDYNATDKGRIPHVDITRDINHDGRDDIVLPDLDGFWLSIQSSDGSFTDPVKLGPPEPFLGEVGREIKRPYGHLGITAESMPWYQGRVHEMDYDHDGRSDLAFWNEDHFDLYRQDEQGLFTTPAESFSLDVPFDADGAYSLRFGPRKKIRRAALLAVRDLNGDGVSDLVIHSIQGRGAIRLHSRYDVHLGSATTNGTVFSPEATSSIQPLGDPGEPAGYAVQWLRDLDGDGRVEIVLQVVRTTLGGMMRVLLGNSIAVDLEFYGLTADGSPREPIDKRRVRPDLHTFKRGRGPFFPAVQLGDVNGDGRADLLTGKDWQELEVFLGVPGPALFAQQPLKVVVDLPRNERNVWLADMNKDGKQDLLLFHPSATAEHRLGILIAR